MHHETVYFHDSRFYGQYQFAEGESEPSEGGYGNAGRRNIARPVGKSVEKGGFCRWS
jgi:hypothetical protein